MKARHNDLSDCKRKVQRIKKFEEGDVKAENIKPVYNN